MDHDNCTAGERFDRIEKWLERLAESTDQVITLITETRHNRTDIDDHETRLRLLEKMVTQNVVWKEWSNKILFIIIAAVIGWFVRGM